jgi:hypothetical protein
VECGTINSSHHVLPCCRPCRVIAFDRPPFGLSERPLEWGADQDNPYEQATGAKLGQVRGQHNTPTSGALADTLLLVKCSPASL